MRVLLITYSSKSKQRNYEPLANAIKNSGTNWWHYLTNTWLIYTERAPDEVFANLHPFIDEKSDYVLVVEIKKNYQGWLPAKAWEWINSKPF
jgi:hypothetical protein